MQIVAT